MPTETRPELTPEEAEICKRLGTHFALLTKDFMPAVTEAIDRVDNDKEISFGCTVKMKREAGVISCKMLANEPKIPTPAQLPVHFLLNRNDEGQLSFLFSGTLKEMRLELAERDIKPDPDDTYVAEDSVVSSGSLGISE